MSATPAEIIRQALLDVGVVNEPANRNTVWPMFVSFLPDDETTPNDAVCIYDTSPVKDGRLMIGTVIEHFGFMIHVRARHYQEGYGRALIIKAALDAIHRATVSISSSEAYLVTSVNRMGGINPMGREPSGGGTKRRELFSINAMTTIIATDEAHVLTWQGDLEAWEDDNRPWDQ